jgi:hypothetical protein
VFTLASTLHLLSPVLDINYQRVNLPIASNANRPRIGPRRRIINRRLDDYGIFVNARIALDKMQPMTRALVCSL